MKLLLLILLALPTACSTLTKEECITTDWNKEGFNDGSKGESNQFSSYKKQCNQFGVSISKSSYEKGHKLGLNEICTYSNGQLFSAQGKGMIHDCGSINSDFERGYTAGIENTEAEQKKNVEEKRDNCCAHWTAGGECVHELSPGCLKNL